MRWYGINIFGLTAYDEELTFETEFDKNGVVIRGRSGGKSISGPGWQCVSTLSGGDGTQKYSKSYNYKVELLSYGLGKYGISSSVRHSMK